MSARKKPAVDMVNHPPHYQGSFEGAVECMDAIQSSMSPEAFAGYLKGNSIKYLWRYEQKGGIESLEKARYYSTKLIEHTKEWG